MTSPITTKTPIGMLNFLVHIGKCQECKELPSDLSLCAAGFQLFLKWQRETQSLFENNGPETDPHRAVLALRYFAKAAKPSEISQTHKATALAIYDRIASLEAEVAKLAQTQCHHEGKSQCEKCGALCPVCDSQTTYRFGVPRD